MELQFTSLGTIPGGWAARSRAAPTLSTTPSTAPGHGVSGISLSDSLSRDAVSCRAGMTRQGSGFGRGNSSPESLRSMHSASSFQRKSIKSSSSDYVSQYSIYSVASSFPSRSYFIQNRSKVYSLTRGMEYNQVIKKCLSFVKRGKWSLLRAQIYNECLFKLESESEGVSSGTSSGDESVSTRGSSSAGDLDPDFKTPAGAARHPDTPKPPPLIPAKPKQSDMQRELLTKKNLEKEIDSLMSSRDKRADNRNSVMAECPSIPNTVCPETPVAVVTGMLNLQLQSTILEEALKDGTPAKRAVGGRGQSEKQISKSDSEKKNAEKPNEKPKGNEKKTGDFSKDFECKVKIFLTDERVKKGEETRWLLWTLITST